jgi:hypothetical protein
MAEQRAVQTAEALESSTAHEFTFIETSAKDSSNVLEVFATLTTAALRKATGVVESTEGTEESKTGGSEENS